MLLTGLRESSIIHHLHKFIGTSSFILYLLISTTPNWVVYGSNVSTSTPQEENSSTGNYSAEVDLSSISFPFIESPEPTEEDVRCPECVIQREVLDRLPPAIYPPRGKDGQPMSLLTKIVVKELMDMSVKTETLTMMVWIRMYWYNHDIHWDAARLRIKEIRVTPRQVWTPDMVISNSLSSFEIMSATNLPLIVGYTGFTYYSIPVIIDAKCQAIVTYFPFDEQTCEIKLMSWTYHSKMVNITLSSYSTGLEGHIGNIEWSITNISAVLVDELGVSNHPLYPGETIRYPYVLYSISLQRKPDFYVNCLVTPSLLLSWLGSIIFLLPSDCGEKLGFSVTLFLALYVNQVVVSEYLPPSADSFPLLARFYTTITLIMGLSILLTVLSLTVHFRIERGRLPQTGSVIVRCLNFLERLGSWSLLGLLQGGANLCGGSSISNPSRSSRVKSSVSQCGLLYESNCGDPQARKYVAKTSVNNGFYQQRPDFMYNTACAQPIPNSSSCELIEIPNGGTTIAGTATGEGNRPKCSKGKNDYVTGLTENEQQHSSKTTTTTEFPKEVHNLLQQIKDLLETMSKTCQGKTSPDTRRQWALIAAGMDTVFFFIYVVTLLIVTAFFAYKTIVR